MQHLGALTSQKVSVTDDKEHDMIWLNLSETSVYATAAVSDDALLTKELTTECDFHEPSALLS